MINGLIMTRGVTKMMNQNVRNYMIASVKRMIYEIEFLSKIMDENRESFNNASDSIEYFKESIEPLDGILRDEFEKEEVDMVEMIVPYQIITEA